MTVGHAPTRARPVEAWFPTSAAFRRTDLRRREHQPGQLNLKSCELLHPAVLDWCAGRLASLSANDVVTYPLTDDTRAAVADALGTTAAGVVLVPGTDFGIRLLSEGFCAPAGRLVIAATHYESWSRYATQYGVTVDAVTPAAGEPLDLRRLARRLDTGAPAVVVVTQPDGCSGQLFAREEIDALSDAVQAHGSLLVVDTCYLAFAEDGEATLAGVHGADHVVRVQSFSKQFGLAGTRIGAILAEESICSYLGRWSPDGHISGVSLRLLNAALADQGMFQAVWREVRRLREELAFGLVAASRLVPRPSGANFVTLDGPAEVTEALYRDLLAAGIRTRLLNGAAGFAGAIRIATPNAAAVSEVVRVATSRGADAAPFDVAVLRAAVPQEEPCRFAVVPRTFADPATTATLCSTFPAAGFSLDVRDDDGSGRKKYRTYNLPLVTRSVVTDAVASLPEPWQQVVHAVLSPPYRSALETATGTALNDCLVEARLVRYGENGWIDAHVDRPDKVVTHLVYLNESWDEARGGSLLLLRDGSLDDVAAEVFPAAGNSVVMVRSDTAWHGVRPVADSSGEDRKVLLVHFVRSDAPVVAQ